MGKVLELEWQCLLRRGLVEPPACPDFDNWLRAAPVSTPWCFMREYQQAIRGVSGTLLNK
jgi:hypothetical protein